MTARKERAGARGRETTIKGDRRRDGAGHRGVDVWPIIAAEVADVAAHEHKGFGRRAREAANVSDGVSRDVEEIEATVSEEVMRRESADFVMGIEGGLVHGATFVVFVKYRAVLIRGVSGHEFLLESGADV